MTLTGWVAGLNHGAHDAAAVLTRFGAPVIWMEQERISRRKHASEESPAESLVHCLRACGLSLEDLDEIVLGSDHDALAQWLGLSATERRLQLPYDSLDRLFPPHLFHRQALPPVSCVPHHFAHAASAYYPSGFDDAALLVMDAMGESSSTSLFAGKNGRIELLQSFGVEESLGFFFEAACRFAGFSRHEAGKLMGLAAYGDARFPMPISPSSIARGQLSHVRSPSDLIGRAAIEAREEGMLSFFERNCFPYEVRTSCEVMAYRDFAASAQNALQSCMLALAERACDLAGSRNLALAGGVSLNCTANGAIANSGIMDSLFIQPASTDSGVAYGAALIASHRLYGADFSPEPMVHAYLGDEVDEPGAIRAALDRARLRYRELDEDSLIAKIVDLLADHQVVGWHQGRAEIGPRALGARSILGNPTRRRTVARINQIKRREIWRPLAPSVPSSEYDRFFVGAPNPFMIVAARVRDEAKPLIPAVVHLDGSARPQVVTESAAPRYHRLLRAVGERTGTPVLINTSLNGPETPICRTADDTVEFFLSCDIDAVAIGNFLVRRDRD